MNLHEYQAKRLFRDYGLPVSEGVVISAVGELADALTTVGGKRWVVKAQVHAGGRGKAGGVRLLSSRQAAEEAVRALLGTRLVTYQTDNEGQPVNQLLIEAPCDIDKELYLSVVIDRSLQRLVIMASTEGGVEIEQVADKTPEKILRIAVDPFLGILPYQCRQMGFDLGLDAKQIKQFVPLLIRLVTLFKEKDISLVEINPLVITKAGDILCLDGKVNIDDNALYRHPDIADMRDTSQEDPRENHAQKWDLNYIALSGNIGCMVNGAGLAMATMDLIKRYGGSPANFLDVGGNATKERVTEAFKIILSDQKIAGVFINIFGGIVRCDLIANGIIEALDAIEVTVPVVVRLEGNNADLGAKKLAEKGNPYIIPVLGFAEAAKRIIEQVG